MAASYPYISGVGNIAHMVNQLRNTFPSAISSDTVKRLGLAPNNESYVINALHFVGVIDEDGNKTDAAAEAFSKHKDEEFQKAFGELVSKAYEGLFSLHGDNAWSLDSDSLITFFRQSDQTSATIGKRQAGTFKVFAALSGHGELPATRATNASGGKIKKENKTKNKSTKSPKNASSTRSSGSSSGESDNESNSFTGNFGLSVKVEINLPSDGTKETYDNIFRSIKENLING